MTQLNPLGKVVSNFNTIDKYPRFCVKLAIEGGWETSVATKIPGSDQIPIQVEI